MMLSMEWDDEVYRDVLLEEGIEIGEARVKRENALRMKANGYSVSEIAEITGLSEEEIAAL